MKSYETRTTIFSYRYAKEEERKKNSKAHNARSVQRKGLTLADQKSNKKKQKNKNK
jgi:hypothetical protein